MDAVQTEFARKLKSSGPAQAPTEELEALGEFYSALAALDPFPRAESGAEVGSYTLVAPNGSRTRVPTSLVAVLELASRVLAQGKAITVVPVGKQLTTQQAANILNISRQYLIKLLDQNELGYTKTGRHRRLKIEDVLRYKETRDSKRLADLAELTRMSQEAGGYD